MLGAALVVTLFVSAAVWWRSEPKPPPRDLGRVPAWQLVDAGGQDFGSEQLADKVWVASFFFTSCRTICPKILGAMARLQKRVDKAGLPVLLVSVSVDPETDTPQVLADFEPKYHIDRKRWRLLTGPRPAVRTLVVDGFKTYMGDKVQVSDNLVDISHGARLVLVDGAVVRGHYSPDAAGLTALMDNARRLLDD